MIGDLFGGIGNWFSGLFNKDAAPAKGPTPAPLSTAAAAPTPMPQAPRMETQAPLAAPAAPMMGPDQARAAMMSAPLAAPTAAPMAETGPVQPQVPQSLADIPAAKYSAPAQTGNIANPYDPHAGNRYLQKLIAKKRAEIQAREAGSPLMDEWNALQAYEKSKGYANGGLVDFAKNEAMNYALPGSSLYGRLGKAVLSGPLGLAGGGGVPLGGGLRNVKELDQARSVGALSKDEYLKALKHLGADSTVSKVKYKKAGGDVSDEMEVSYHNPLAAAGKSDKSGG